MARTPARRHQVDWSDTRRLDKLARRGKHVRLIRTDGQVQQGRLTGIETTGPTTRMLHLDTPDGPVHAGATTTGYRIVA